MKNKLKSKDLVSGMQSFDLKLLEFSGQTHDKRGKIWSAICLCGETTTVGSYEFVKGNKKSCGCRKNKKNPKYGQIKTKDMPEYETWCHIKRRCSGRSKCPGDASYTKRGITVCERWQNSFQNFYDDMDPRPSPKHSIDRKNNEEGYFPENCWWATAEEQQNNRSNNVRISHNGETKTIAQWAKETNISDKAFRRRLNLGWPMEECLHKNKREIINSFPEELEFRGETLSTEEWAARIGILKKEINRRLSRGWTIERTLTQKRKNYPLTLS